MDEAFFDLTAEVDQIMADENFKSLLENPDVSLILTLSLLANLGEDSRAFAINFYNFSGQKC